MLNLTEETKSNMKSVLFEAGVLLENKLIFNFQSVGETKEIAIDELPAETLALILSYGTRKLNDKVNSIFGKAGNEETREAIIERVWKESLEGKLGERKAQSNGNAGLRNFILSWLRNNGVKAAALADLKGATPQTIINEIWPNQTEEYKEKALKEFTRRYEESLKAIEIDIPVF